MALSRNRGVSESRFFFVSVCVCFAWGNRRTGQVSQVADCGGAQVSFRPEREREREKEGPHRPIEGGSGWVRVKDWGEGGEEEEEGEVAENEML